MKSKLSLLLLSLLIVHSHAQDSQTPSTGTTLGATGSVNAGAGTSAPGVETDRVASQPVTSASSRAVSVMVLGGQAFMSRGGVITKIEKDISLTISPSGNITGFDQKDFSLSEGQMLTLDGRMMAIPESISSTLNASGATPAATGR